MRARLLVNAVCHRYLIPAWQVGTKVHVDDATGQVEDLFSVVRHLVPGETCLRCSNLIDDTRLAEEAVSPRQRAAQRYVPEVPAPSVITLNAVTAAHAANDYLLTTVALTETESRPEWIRHHPLQRRLAHLVPQQAPACTECIGRLGAGQTELLPVRAGTCRNTSSANPVRASRRDGNGLRGRGVLSLWRPARVGHRDSVRGT